MSVQIRQGSDDGPGRVTAKPEAPTPSRWRRPTVALLLSLIFPGLGQLMNREPGQGFFFAVTLPVLTVLAFFGRIVLLFGGLVSFFFIGIGWRIWICADAFRIARRGTQSKKSFRQARLTFIVLGSLIVACGVGPSSDYFLHQFGYFRAFRVSSSSFCPTICEGERVVADMDAYLKFAPKQGDVILFDYH